MNKRWPLIVAVGSAIAYVGNNYRIGGLDQLRLERRSVTTSTSHLESTSRDASSGQFPMPVSSLHPLPTVSTGSTFQPNGTLDDLPPWQPQLSVGEKLAVMQDRLSEKIGELANPSGSDSNLPVAPPLNLPPGIVKSRPISEVPNSGSTGLTSPNTSKSSPGLMAGSSVFDGQVASLRIATFSVQGLGATHLAKPTVTETLVSMLRQFEIVALQGIQSDRDDILPLIIERLNQSGRQYDYLIGPRIGPNTSRQQLAFLFDASRIETDRYQLYTVDDPENLVAYEPLVAWFRCKGVPADQAFTFSLVNVKIDPVQAQAEQAILTNLIHAVVNDGRQEDDVIALGDFAGNSASISALNIESIRHAIRDIPTDVSGERMLSGILLPAHATCEFTGRSGVLDFLRKYNLSIERAMEISQQMPVWAEFYVVEGAQPGRVAPPPSGNSL